MSAPRFVVDPLDPRAPSREVWEQLTESERRHVLMTLPSEFPLTEPPEGDEHRLPKERALETLSEFYRSRRRPVYLSAELPIYYPGERMFAPDLLAVLDVENHPRDSWVTSHEGKGLDFVLEINVSGSQKKDFEDNVVRYARLGIPEYFAFDVRRKRLLGWRLASTDSLTYEAIVPVGGRFSSRVLDLELSLEGGQLRFFHGTAPLLDAQELVARLSTMVDEALLRAEEQARRAEEESRRAEEESRRAEEESQRAQQESGRVAKLAARLRELGVDPDEIV
ncbi:MAG TPA: Uma2 family endonuclease [Polyangiaceae bacterium]|nr:Uma2 family endonuclease [Polyangiaceae bacterium]